MNVMYKRIIPSTGRRCFNNNQYVPLSRTRRKLWKGGVFITAGGIAGFVASKHSDGTTDFLAHVGAISRFIRSLKIGVMISMDYYFSMMGLNEEAANYAIMMSRIHYRAANRMLKACLENGGTYIKLGQGLVSMSHILPKEYVEVLTALQDKCLTRDVEELYAIFNEEFGKDPSDLYQHVETTPLAAASLAQVFKAVTLDGQEVAIKVQYIDLQRRFVSDVATIDFLLKLVGVVHPSFNFGWVLEDLSESLRQELDFVREGRNSERCAADLKHLKYVYVPKVRWDLSSKRILVTEYVNGTKINERAKLVREGLRLDDIDKKVIEAFGHQIFQTGFVHADPHPGNILIRKKKNKAEIVLLDHGLYQELSEEHKNALSFMWKSIVLRDFKGMKENAEKLGVTDYEVLAEILTQRPLRMTGFKITRRISDKDLEYIAIATRKRFDKVMNVLREMPRSLLLVVRNLNTIRAISYDHGDPIDRYTVLARCATKQAFTKTTLYRRVRQVPTLIYFEFKIASGKIWVWLIKNCLNIIRLLGRSPDTGHLIKDLN